MPELYITNWADQWECGHGSVFCSDWEIIPGENGAMHNKIKCLKCNQFEHYASSWPQEIWIQQLQIAEELNGKLEYGFTFLQVSKIIKTFYKKKTSCVQGWGQMAFLKVKEPRA